MALYPYRCTECGHYEEIYQRISEYSESPRVPHCRNGHGAMSRYFTVPMTIIDFQSAVVSPIDGKVLESRSQHREYMKRNNLVLHDDIAPDIARAAKERQREAVADVKRSVIEAVQMVEAGYKPQVASDFVPS